MQHHWPLFLVLGSLLLTGCSKAPPVARPGGSTTTNRQNGPGAVAAPRVDNPEHQADPSQRAYQGRTAADWAGDLESRDTGVRQQAAQALRALGETGYPMLVKGLKNPAPEVRLQALEAMDLKLLKKHQDQTVPLLINTTRDPNPAVREQAAIRLAWFDSSDTSTMNTGVMAGLRLQALQALANDKNPNVRTAANNSLRCIQDAVKGKPAGDK
jgi:hypothetical protein